MGAADGTGAGGVGAAERFGNGNGPEFAGGVVFYARYDGYPQISPAVLHCQEVL